MRDEHSAFLRSHAVALLRCRPEREARKLRLYLLAILGCRRDPVVLYIVAGQRGGLPLARSCPLKKL